MADIGTTHRLARLLTAVVPGALLLAPAAAHAERAVIRDAGHDVVWIDQEASDAADTEVVVPAPHEGSTDITRVVVDHGVDVLKVTVHVGDLGHNFFDGADIQLRSQQRLWGVQVLRSGRETYTSLTRGHRESERACGGLITTVDKEADTVVVSVPTTCIEDPRWVRVGVGLISAKATYGSTSGDQLVPFWDEAGVTGFEDDHVEVRGPKVQRG